MKPSIPITFFYVVLIWSLTAGCNISNSGSDDSSGGIDVQALNEVCTDVTGAYRITLYTPEAVRTAFTPLYIDIRNAADDEIVEQAELELIPMMDMGEHEHSAPVWQSGTERDPESGLFEAAFIPTMPGGSMGGWYMDWQIAGQYGGGDNCAFDVSDAPKVKVFTAADGERYILTWIKPQEPETGANELELALHLRESMMSFPPVAEADIAIKPWMGSMDHGSEGSEHPQPAGDGFYRGSVVFNMSGDWEVYVTLLDDEGDELYEAEYRWNVK